MNPIDLRNSTNLLHHNPLTRFADEECETNNQPTGIPYVSRDNVSVNGVLGQGSYATVYEAELKDYHYPFRLAMKCLNPVTINSERGECAIEDLRYEAKILSRLDHPNIIKLRGISSNSTLHSSFQPDKGYFLLLDILEETLDEKCSKWRKQEGSKGFNPLKSIKGNKRQGPSVHDRLQVALDIAKAMEYIHSEGIVHRDLKPQNIGFDHEGKVKLFDLGMARPVEQCIKNNEIAGSYRYMAPENALANCSGFPSDVYSFGVLFWELITMQMAYREFFRGNRKASLLSRIEKFKEGVVVGGSRPSLSGVYSPAIKDLIQRCWAANPEDRPTFSQIVVALTEVCETHESPLLGSCSEISFNSSASTMLSSEPDTPFSRFSPRKMRSSIAMNSLPFLFLRADSTSNESYFSSEDFTSEHNFPDDQAASILDGIRCEK